MSRDVILIRHGQSTFNAIHSVTGEDPMHVDARLTELGRRQVEDARARLSHLSPALVVMSPLTRAIETALGIFGDRDAEFLVTDLHREHLESSCDVGRAPRYLAEEFPHLDFAHLDEHWWHDGPLNERGLPVEPHEMLVSRIGAFTQWLAAREEKTIAVIGHGTFFFHLTGKKFQNCESVLWTPGAGVRDVPPA